jgi:hypothetical protein
MPLSGQTSQQRDPEEARVVLLRPLGSILDHRGCWLWDVEDEATWLASTLLIPGSATWRTARRRLSISKLAKHFECSAEVTRWQLDVTSTCRRLTA